MKPLLAALLSLLVLTSTVRGQPTAHLSGLYRSAADFRQHRLALSGDCTTGKYRLLLNELLSRPYVTVVQPDRKYIVLKDSLFGFRDCAGREYRFADNNRYYPILNPGEELLIYKVEQKPMGRQPGYRKLYFSATATAPIQPLTLLALKQAFPTSYRLHDSLDAQFREQDDLAVFDDFHKMTKINWLLQRSRSVAGK